MGVAWSRKQVCVKYRRHSWRWVVRVLWASISVVESYRDRLVDENFNGGLWEWWAPWVIWLRWHLSEWVEFSLMPRVQNMEGKIWRLWHSGKEWKIENFSAEERWIWGPGEDNLFFLILLELLYIQVFMSVRQFARWSRWLWRWIWWG